MKTTDVTAPEIIRSVTATFDRFFVLIDEWRDELQRAISAESSPTAATFDPRVEQMIMPALTSEIVNGAGFVAAPGLLHDAQWHLAWWLMDSAASASPRRLATVDNPSSDQFRDYTALEWWRVPARSLTRHLTGPYVDYLCTDDYTVTITTPVMAGDEMLGVVGVDCLVDRLEREMRPILCAHGAAAIVNASSRVVSASDAHRETGSILRLSGLADALAPLRDAEPGAVDTALPNGTHVYSCGNTSLALITGL